MPKEIDGKTYVTQTEFSEKMKVSYRTVLNYVEKGALKLERFGNANYLNLEESESAFRKEQAKRLRNISKKYRPQIIQELPTIQNIDTDLPCLEGIIIDDVEDITPEEMERKVRWFEYTDCVCFTQSMQPVMNPITKKPLMDYERLKSRLTAERFRLDVKERLEPYLTAEENLEACTMVENTLLNKDFSKEYTSVISKWVEKTYGKKLSKEAERRILTTLQREEKNFKQNCQETLKQQRGLSCYEV